MSQQETHLDTGIETESHGSFPLARRDFVKGGLAAGTLLGMAGVANASASEPTPQSLDDGQPAEREFMSLFYSNGIQGGSQIAGREGASDVYGFDWLTPGPAAEGRPPQGSGVLYVEKAVDTASPQLYQAAIQGTALDEVELRLFRVNPTGSLERFYSVKLATARVTGIELHTTNPVVQFTEIVGFLPETVTITHDDGYEYQFLQTELRA